MRSPNLVSIAAIVLASYLVGMALLVPRVSSRPPYPLDYEKWRAAMKPATDYIASTLSTIRKAEASGNNKRAEEMYQKLLNYEYTKRSPGIRLDYAKLLEREGKYEAALQAAHPLLMAGSQFEAVQMFVRVLRKTKGEKAVDTFLEESRDVILDGQPMHWYEAKGLTAKQALIFIEGCHCEGPGKWPEAERIFRQLLPQDPPSEMFYHQVAGVLSAQHRRNEIAPILAQWYLHSSPEMRATIKRHWNNLFFDFPRLDAQLHPTP